MTQHSYYWKNREAIRKKQREYYHKNRDRILARQKETAKTPEAQQRRREYRRTYWSTYARRPSAREKRKERMRTYNHLPEVKSKRAEYMRRMRQNPVFRVKERQRAREYNRLPKNRERQLRWERATYHERKPRLNNLRKIRSRKAGVSPRRKTIPERDMELLLNTDFPGDWKYTGQGDVTLGRCAPDFFNVNGKKAIIEVYGCYHHGCPSCGHPARYSDPDHDNRRTKMFEEMGYKTLVVWEHELKTPIAVAQRIQGAFYR